MVVRLDLEGAGPAIANINDASVFARPLQHSPAVSRKPAQVHARGLVGAVLAPHHAEDAQLSEARFAPKQALDFLVFLGREAVLLDYLRGNSWDALKGRHIEWWKCYCRIEALAGELLLTGLCASKTFLALLHLIVVRRPDLYSRGCLG